MRRQSVLLNDKMQWFNEFSDIGSEMLSQSNLTLAKAHSIHCEHSHSTQNDIVTNIETATQHSCGAYTQFELKYKENEKLLSNIDKLSFDIW